mmetsp:Transcript_17427/g.29780  ORF Transcript_17427/g.29780 Transcript_17427/m.29780 type:complete len:250 (-) Transcript_17427:90-839(-)
MASQAYSIFSQLGRGVKVFKTASSAAVNSSYSTRRFTNSSSVSLINLITSRNELCFPLVPFSVSEILDFNPAISSKSSSYTCLGTVPSAESCSPFNPEIFCRIAQIDVRKILRFEETSYNVSERLFASSPSNLIFSSKPPCRSISSSISCVKSFSERSKRVSAAESRLKLSTTSWSSVSIFSYVLVNCKYSLRNNPIRVCSFRISARVPSQSACFCETALQANTVQPLSINISPFTNSITFLKITAIVG